MCWGGGSTYAYIYMRIANFYRKKTSGSGYQYLAWYNQSSVGTVGSRVLLLAVLPTVINGGDQAQSPLCPPPSSVPFSPSSPPRSPIAHRHPSLKEKAFFQSISQSVSHTGRSQPCIPSTVPSWQCFLLARQTACRVSLDRQTISVDNQHACALRGGWRCHLCWDDWLGLSVVNKRRLHHCGWRGSLCQETLQTASSRPPVLWRDCPQPEGLSSGPLASLPSTTLILFP